MKNLFLDSNIWLSLYDFSSDDLEQFSKLKELIDKDIRLFIPMQTRNEIQRNRDAKIKGALSRFEKFEFAFPAFCKSYSEYPGFSHDFNELKRKHKAWCDKIHDDIKRQDLAADRVIHELLEMCPVIECPPELIRAAEIRFKAGNPPGKDNKLGDAINWECLLSSVPDGEDLFFISGDKDFRSVVDDNSFNLFLKEEWSKRKHSRIIFFVSLLSFLKAHVQEIELQTEQQKEELIAGLFDSHNFQTTHAVIRSLREYHDWSAQQIDDLCSAAINNTQVSWILEDEDVFDFYEDLLSSTKATSDSITEIKSRIAEIKEEHDEENGELPFVRKRKV